VVLDSRWSHRSFGAFKPRNADPLPQVGTAKRPTVQEDT